MVKVWRRTETGEAPRGPQRGSRVGVGRGCIARRMQPDFHHRLLSQAAVLLVFTSAPVAAISTTFQGSTFMTVSEESDLITSKEVMDRLLADPRLRRIALTCVLSAVRYRDEWRFRRSDLESWIARQLGSTTAPRS